MIKGIFWDFDGVITSEKMGSPTITSYISKYTGLPYDLVNTEYRKYNNDMLYGRITHKDMWASFCDAIGRKVPYEILSEAFLNVKLDPKVIDIIRGYKDKYLIGMITDNKVDRIEAILDHTELKGLFDVVIISANVHSRKTEEDIFVEALKQSGLAAEECVFIDNTIENLDAPNRMGFKTVYFDDEIRDYELLKF
jgi:putative hydrolase of the HAD superfamily